MMTTTVTDLFGQASYAEEGLFLSTESSSGTIISALSVDDDDDIDEDDEDLDDDDDLDVDDDVEVDDADIAEIEEEPVIDDEDLDDDIDLDEDDDDEDDDLL